TPEDIRVAATYWASAVDPEMERGDLQTVAWLLRDVRASRRLAPARPPPPRGAPPRRQRQPPPPPRHPRPVPLLGRLPGGAPFPLACGGRAGGGRARGGVLLDEGGHQLADLGRVGTLPQQADAVGPARHDPHALGAG